MRFTITYDSDVLSVKSVLIETEPGDDVIRLDDDPYIRFWQQIDKAAEKIGVLPFCPCADRPHRVSCPLGFSKYFTMATSEASKEGK